MTTIVIMGGPRTGKTTMADRITDQARHTDDTIGLGWDGAIDEVSRWMDGAGVIEGTQAVRGMRKWLADHPTGKPCDEVVYLKHSIVLQTRGQRIMAKGINTVFEEIKPELIRRGVVIKQGA